MESTRSYQDALRSWVGGGRWGVAGTVTFVPYLPTELVGKRAYLGAEDARQAVRHYLRRLDRVAYGANAERKGKTVAAVVVREGAAEWGRKHVHYHLALGVPDGYEPEDWAERARQCWTDLRWASPGQNVFKPIRSDGWLDYIFKDRDKTIYLDAMDFDLWRLV